MTGTHATLANLQADCDALGIRLEVVAGRLDIDAPQDALTLELWNGLIANKDGLVRLIAEAPEIDRSEAAEFWHGALDRLDEDPLLPPDLIDVLRSADVQWADDPEAGEADEATEVIDPPDPCPDCGSLELWQSFVGGWQCRQCDPPLHTLTRRRGLIGVGFAPQVSPQPPREIIAKPIAVCPACSQTRVLPELSRMTGGLCCGCWSRAAETSEQEAT